MDVFVTTSCLDMLCEELGLTVEVRFHEIFRFVCFEIHVFHEANKVLGNEATKVRLVANALKKKIG